MFFVTCGNAVGNRGEDGTRDRDGLVLVLSHHSVCSAGGVWEIKSTCQLLTDGANKECCSIQKVLGAFGVCGICCSR